MQSNFVLIPHRRGFPENKLNVNNNMKNDVGINYIIFIMINSAQNRLNMVKGSRNLLLSIPFYYFFNAVGKLNTIIQNLLVERSYCW